MTKNKTVKLYNVLLPIWLLIFVPSFLWLVLIPLNYLIDRIVLKWSLKDMDEKGAFCRKHNWKICIAGFVNDFIGVLFLFGTYIALSDIDQGSPVRKAIGNVVYGLGFDPFSNVLALVIIVLAIAIAGACIYFVDKRILAKAGLDTAQAKNSALKLALITAPYLFLIPSSILYR